MTHPIVWFVIPRIVSEPYWVLVVFAESFAVIAEGIYFYALRAYSFPRAMLFSLLANASSCGLGFLCRAKFGWP